MRRELARSTRTTLEWAPIPISKALLSAECRLPLDLDGAEQLSLQFQGTVPVGHAA